MNLRRRFKVPTTTEDADAIDVVRVKIKKYFSHKGKDLHKAPEARARSYGQIREQFWLHKFAFCILLLVAVGLELCPVLIHVTLRACHYY